MGRKNAAIVFLSIITIASFATTLVLSSSNMDTNSTEMQKFIGRWWLNIQEYNFHSNETFRYLRYPLCGTPPLGEVYEINGTFKIENGQLILMFKNLFWIFDYSFSNDNFILTLTNIENGITENFTKKPTLS